MYRSVDGLVRLFLPLKLRYSVMVRVKLDAVYVYILRNILLGFLYRNILISKGFFYLQIKYVKIFHSQKGIKNNSGGR